MSIQTPSGQNDFLPLEYEGLQLPELNPQEERLKELDLSVDAFETRQQLHGRRTELKEAAKRLQGSRMLRFIDQRVAEFCEASIRALASNASILKGMDMQDLSEHAISAVVQKEWGGVADDSGEKFVLRDLIAKANQLKFALVQRWLQDAKAEGFSTGLNEVATAEYEHLMPALAATDRMFIKMMTEKSPIDSDERVRRGLTNECAIVREIEGKVIEVPFDEAYPEETEVIVRAYSCLIEELELMHQRFLQQKETATDATSQLKLSVLSDLALKKLRYYRAVRTAFAVSNINAWRQADVLLPQQIDDGADVTHIHPIETHYMRDRIVRAPEISLRAPDLDEPLAQQLSAKTKTNMLRSFAQEPYIQMPAIRESLPLLGDSNAVARHFLGSGMEMELKPAGQILPNEVDSRIKGGIDSSLDVSSMRERMPAMAKLFGQVLGERAAKIYCDYIVKDAEGVTGSEIAAHELGHAVGLMEGYEERLGGGEKVGAWTEEWKATAGGMVGNLLKPYENGDCAARDLMFTISFQLMAACRYAKLRNHPMAAAYFRHSMMLLKVMEETGVLKMDEADSDQPWKLNLSTDSALAFFKQVAEQHREYLTIIAEGDEGSYNDFVERNLQLTPFIEFMCERVGDIPDADNNTPAMLARSPRMVARAQAEAAAEAARLATTLEGIGQAAVAAGTPETGEQ